MNGEVRGTRRAFFRTAGGAAMVAAIKPRAGHAAESGRNEVITAVTFIHVFPAGSTT